MDLSRIDTRRRMLIGFFLAVLFLLISYNQIFSQYFFDEDDFAYVGNAVYSSTPGYVFTRESQVQSFPRPVVHLYFWIISVFAGTAAWPYFLINLLLYALTSVLAYRLVLGLFQSTVAAVFAGLFYLVSPCATDNLYWVAAGGTGFLSAALILLTLNIYVSRGYNDSTLLRILSWITAILACGTKESALTLPLLLAALELFREGSRTGWLKRLAPFFIISAVFAVNVVLVQLSYSDDANFSRYGLSWLIPRNLIHYVLFPLIGAMPPDPGRYTVLKLIVYPLIWMLPLFLGRGRVRRMFTFGLLWVVVSSLPFLPWKMGGDGFFPSSLDIPSRYFNIPSIGASVLAASLILMLKDRWRRAVALGIAALILIPTAVSGVIYTNESSRWMLEEGQRAKTLLDMILSNWDGSEYVYVGAFGFRETRIKFYNMMYFHGRLIRMDPFPSGLAAGTKMICGPATTPSLYVFDGQNWDFVRNLQGYVPSVPEDEERIRR